MKLKLEIENKLFLRVLRRMCQQERAFQHECIMIDMEVLPKDRYAFRYEIIKEMERIEEEIEMCL